jgi:WS/DGAT/MGAT family acyltransferase
MVDGASGANLMTVLFRRTPDSEVEAAPAWCPRPGPAGWQLLALEQWRRARVPALLLGEVRSALQEPRAAGERLVEAGAAVREAVEAGLRVPAATPLNRPIGPHRRLDWCSVPLTTLKETRSRLGGTVNDVILAAICGGLRRFLGERGAALEGLDYRVVIPVDVRPEGDDFSAANRVSAYFLSLPLAEANPVRRLEIIRAETRRLKESGAAEGIALLTRLADWTGTLLTLVGVRLVSRLHPYNLIVTNVPGPQFRLYLLGAPLLEMHPQLPLFANQGLGIAAMSYCGRVCFGLVGDREVTTDLGALTEAIEASVEELAQATPLPPSATRDKRAGPGGSQKE